MPIPTEVVGSLPRPSCKQEAYYRSLWIIRGSQGFALTIRSDLQKTFADYDAGTAKLQDLVAAQDKAAEDSLNKMAEAGEALITDGEQRASSFATYPITDTLGGTGLASNLAADGQYVWSCLHLVAHVADGNM